jgi:hypothetical protein
MSERDDLSSELRDEFLHAQADAGDYLLEEEAFYYRPTLEELQLLVLQGQGLLFLDAFKQQFKSRLDM